MTVNTKLMTKSFLTICFVGLGLLRMEAQCTYTVSSVKQDVDCHGAATGSATAIVTGQSGPYSIAWNSSPPQSGLTATGLTAGNYTITVTDALNCIVNHLVTIDEPVFLSVSLGADTTVCENSTFTLSSAVGGGTTPYTYLWACNQVSCGIANSSDVVPSITAGNVDAQYFLQITDANGCANSDFLTVSISQAATVDAGADEIIYLGDDVKLNAVASGAGTFVWSPANSLDDAFINDPVASPTSLTNYTVLFTDLNGCTGTDVVTVDVNYDLVIPTGLTPNGDSKNDTWGVKGLVPYADLKAEVFNRFGDRVYLGYANDPAWDGTYLGNPLPAGTYFYTIDLGDGSNPLNGILTLIR